MTPLSELFLNSFLVVTTAMTVLWRISLWRRDASIVDPFWELDSCSSLVSRWPLETDPPTVRA